VFIERQSAREARNVDAMNAAMESCLGAIGPIAPTCPAAIDALGPGSGRPGAP
jgi:hypothetical protein